MTHRAASTEKFAAEHADCIAAFARHHGAKGTLRCSTVEQWDTHKMAQPAAPAASDAPG
jgi:hypothetical protein